MLFYGGFKVFVYVYRDQRCSGIEVKWLATYERPCSGTSLNMFPIHLCGINSDEGILNYNFLEIEIRKYEEKCYIE
jgi:hypothetical protein